jgi:acyl dehydratase
MSDRVLLTDDLRARIGETATYTAPEPLGRASLRYFALAVGDENPLWTDRSFARDHGYDDVVAPPTLIAETNQYMPGPRDGDGFMGHSWHITVPDTRLVRGGNAYEFHRPAGPDTVVTATWRIADMTERRTSAGLAMLVITSEAAYTDQDGELLMTNTETLVFTELPAAGGAS